MRRTFPAALRAAALLTGIVLVLAGCGLERFVILAAPVAIINAADDRFEFRATSDNSEVEFRGFELYYRVFSTSDIPVNFYNTFDELVAAAYRRVYDPAWAPGSTSFRKPLIRPDPADYGKSYTVTVDFSAFVSLADFPRISTAALVPITPITISQARRAVTDVGQTEYKRFQKNDFDATDADITADLYNTYISLGLNVKLVMFVVSYGVDTSSNLEVYSLPVWLGDEDIAFP